MATKYTKAKFFELLVPVVIQVRQEGSQIFPSVRLAQGWLETGGTINDWNNLGGYKVGSGKTTPYWNGASVNTATKEVYNGVTVTTRANWRAYNSIYDFYKDQDLLFENNRYARVRAALTPEEQCQALLACGYATDPEYANKLISIIKANSLKKYDKEADGDMAKIAELEATVAALETRIAALEKIVNVSGNQEPPKWAHEAIGAAKAAGVITTSNDKGRAELITLQMLYNAGLLDADILAAIKALKKGTK
ncbi:glucosaminidase domain-containing protein [Paenibacillus sp. M1]|uniref:Glucosaminidase domain-containing protein n=1 Tax=Paenibacillus haidiansis TaxID=1574488 RepID=A0ABU7VN84_9BACL